MKQFIGIYKNKGLYYLLFRHEEFYHKINMTYQRIKYTRQHSIKDVVNNYINDRFVLYASKEDPKRIQSYIKVDVSKSYPELMI